jgi:hypothetical protein
MKRKTPSLITALFLLISAASPALAAGFTDVLPGHPHKEAIDYVTTHEFMLGHGDGTFDPDGPITRVDFIKVWAKTFHARRHNFQDVQKVYEDTDNAIILMQGLGYVAGIKPTEFGRTSQITRQEVAQVIYNTYLKGIDGKDSYKVYTDEASVAVWARNAVSVCTDKGFFAKIAGAAFQPEKPITRGEVCEVLMQLLRTEYTVTVAPTSNGTVTSLKSKAYQGETVGLTVDAAPGYRLASGSLKYNGNVISTGTSFTMPAANVIVTAEFEELFTITVAPMTNGTVTSLKTVAAEGETVSLTIDPASGYKLADGSLKFNTTDIIGTSFAMPGTNVTIYAEFETI